MVAGIGSSAYYTMKMMFRNTWYLVYHNNHGGASSHQLATRSVLTARYTI